MMRWCALLHRADRRALLGFKVWEFSWHSLPHPYGRAFITGIMLRHPLCTLKGLLAYRRFVQERPVDSGVAPLLSQSLDSFLREAAESGDKLLVATGFCQKPLAGEENPACPTGRAVHRCTYLASLDLRRPYSKLHPACAICDIRVVGEKALRAGATLYIMTSAMDIAHDLFLPTLAQGRFRHILMSICPYSVHPMALSLFICAVQAILFTYSVEACDNYTRWLMADRGIKPEQTFLAPETNIALLHFLDEVAAVRTARDKSLPRRYRREGNLYVPETC
jgi:hypothetical protein